MRFPELQEKFLNQEGRNIILDDRAKASLYDRWDKAEVIHLAGGVTPLGSLNTRFSVQSQGQADTVYEVDLGVAIASNLGCQCKDYQLWADFYTTGAITPPKSMAPYGWCKHRLSSWITIRCVGVHTEAPQAQLTVNQKESEMQEAQSSINFRMLLNGVDCQFTVRGADEYETLARARKLIATVLGQYPQEAPSEPAPVQLQPEAPVISPTKENKPKKAEEAKPQSRKPVCNECGAIAIWKEGVSKRTQKPYSFWKCDPCDEILTKNGAFQSSQSAA